MRILVIGGTRFVGRHIVDALLAEGHDVTLLNRGRSGTGLFPTARRLVADRDDPAALTAALSEGAWDATIDVSAYFPGQVESLADALGGRGGHHVLISTASVYRPTAPGFGEDGPLWPTDGPVPTEITDETYGPLKVRCEQAAARHAELLILRPTYVIGPYDDSRRFDYWVHRLAAGGDILAPGDPEAPMQVIDARDIAGFVARALATGLTGTFHLVGASDTYTFRDLLDDIRPGLTYTWVGVDFLRAAGETLPLWSGGDPFEDLASTASPAASLAAGLTVRPVAESARDVLAFPADDLGGLTPAREAELLAAWRSQTGPV